MAMANTITVIYPPFENQESFQTPQRWNIIQTVGTWTAAGSSAGNKDIISDLSSGAYEVRLMNLTISIGLAATQGAHLVTAAKDTFAVMTPETGTTSMCNSWNFGPVGMLVDITSTTAVVALVAAVTLGGYFYCQIAKRTK